MSARISRAGTRISSQGSRFDVDNMMASWNHIFSPTTVLEVKFGRNVPTLPQPPVNTKISSARIF